MIELVDTSIIYWHGYLRHDVRWDLALSLKPLFIMVSNSACENKALYFRCFIQYQF